MFSSIHRSYTGLLVNETGLNMVGNNLSNLNTVGYKRSQANFGQLMVNSSLGANGAGNPIQIGLGANLSQITSHFSQGSFLRTGEGTDLALQGNGFFVVNDGTSTSYTRAGNFTLNSSGNLVSATGHNVQGYTQTNADGTIDTTGATGDIFVDFEATSPARATNQVRFATNLSAASEEGDEFLSSINVFDSNGVEQALGLKFTRTANAGEWTYEFVPEEGAISTTSPTQGTGTLTFDANGQLAQVDGADVSAASNRNIEITGLPGGADNLSFSWEVFDTDTNTGYLTNLGERSNTGSVFQNGTNSGELQRVEFALNGIMLGFYDNGDNVALAQVALATFPNNQGLRQGPGGLYQQGPSSGAAILEPAGRTQVFTRTLETSNVDIAEEFVDLIVHQRGYQSNSKSISTADQVIQEILNLKR